MQSQYKRIARHSVFSTYNNFVYFVNSINNTKSMLAYSALGAHVDETPNLTRIKCSFCRRHRPQQSIQYIREREKIRRK